MYMAWGLILPFGVLYPALWKNAYKSMSHWFAEHVNLQRNGSLLAFLSTAIVMGGIEEHFGSAHQVIGTTIMILLAQHVLFALLRPDQVELDRADIPLDDKISRLLWAGWHWIIGYGMVAVSWFNIYLGFEKLKRDYNIKIYLDGQELRNLEAWNKSAPGLAIIVAQYVPFVLWISFLVFRLGVMCCTKRVSFEEMMDFPVRTLRNLSLAARPSREGDSSFKMMKMNRKAFERAPKEVKRISLTKLSGVKALAIHQPGMPALPKVPIVLKNMMEKKKKKRTTTKGSSNGGSGANGSGRTGEEVVVVEEKLDTFTRPRLKSALDLPRTRR